MSNRLDKLFKDGILRHHLPNDGPNWDQLEARMNGKKRKPFLFLGWSAAILMLGLITLYFFSLREVGRTVTTESKTIDNPNAGIEKSKTENDKHTNQSSTQTEVLPTINQNPSAAFITNHKKINPNSESSTHNNSVKETMTEKATPPVTNTPKTAQEIEDSIRSIRLRKPENTKPDDSAIAEVAPIIKEDTVAAAKPLIASNAVITSVIKKTYPTPHLISIYALFSPALINSSVLTQEDKMTNKSFSKLRSDGEKMKNSMGLDFGIRFSPFKRISFSAGFIYEKRTETVEYHFLRDEGPIVVNDTINGPFIAGYFKLSPSAAERIDFSSTNTYTYLGIPLAVNFDIPLLKWFGVGMQLNGSYIMQNSLQGKTIDKTYLNLVDLTSKNSTQIKNIFNAGLGLNLRFSLTKNLILNITPDYKKQLSKNVNTTSPMQSSLKICLQYFIF